MLAINQIRTGFKNTALRSVGVYIFTNFFSKGISFILIPLFTNPLYLSPTDNGLLSLFSSNLILLAPFVSLGMIQSSSADFYKKTPAEFSNAFTTNFFISATMAVLGMIILFLCRDFLRAKFDFPDSFIFLLPFLAFLVFSGEQLFALIRNRNEVKQYATVGISKALLEYGVSVILIVFFFTGWKGRIWGIAASLIAVNLFAVYYYTKHKYIKFGFRKKDIWEELKFGLPIFVFQLSLFMISTSNKFFLALFNVDKYQLGIYSIACILGAMVGVISQSIILHVQPKLYKSISSGEVTMQSVKKDFFNYFKLLTSLSIVCVAGLVFTYFFVINKIYLSGLPYFFIVALSSYIWGLNYFLFLFLLYHKQKRKILIIAAIAIVSSAALNYIMVKYYLIWGDAISTLISTIVYSGLILLFIKKVIHQTVNNSKAAGIIA